MKKSVDHGQIWVDWSCPFDVGRTYSIYILCCGNMHGILMEILQNFRFKIRHSYHLFWQET